MFRLSKTFRFESSHQLMHHDGKCARLHGHSWKGTLVVSGNDLDVAGPKQNMLLDYAAISKTTKEIEQVLDHQHLNEVLGTEMPTSEFVAKWIYDTYHPRFPKDAPLTEVIIEETCTSQCQYSPR